jgi:Zn-dependent protease with chaperone function
MRRRVSFGLVVVSGLVLWAAGAPAFAQQGREVKGLVEYRKGDVVIVDGQRVRLTAATKIKVKGAPAGQAVPLGYEVKANGIPGRDGALTARQLEAKPNPRDAKELELIDRCKKIEEIYVEAGYALRPRDGRVETLGALSTSGPLYDRSRKILDRLLPPYLAPADVRLYVVDNRDWNAFAMANFAIFVHSGLLADMNDDEVAIVLGHELAHATLEHTRRNMSKGRWGRIAAGITAVGGSVLAIATGDDLLADMGGDAIRSIGSLGASALTNGFSRGFEDEADRVGVRYAFEGGYKAEQAPALWRRFGEKYQDGSGVGTFLFGSHSQSKDRARNMEAEVRKNYQPGTDTPSRVAPEPEPTPQPTPTPTPTPASKPSKPKSKPRP